MKTRHALVSAITLSLLGAAAFVGAQPAKEQPAQEHDPSAHADPGPRHAKLRARVGNYTITFKTTGLGHPAQETKGKAAVTETLGGRFITIAEDGELFGMPFTAHKTFGYNNLAGKYESVWMYTHSTAIMTLSGVSADDGATINFDASFEMMEGQRMKMKVIFKEIDADTFMISLVGLDEAGKEMSRADATYTRTK